jgi:hypothetical protein
MIKRPEWKCFDNLQILGLYVLFGTKRNNKFWKRFMMPSELTN